MEIIKQIKKTIVIKRLSKYKTGGILVGSDLMLYCFECEIEMHVNKDQKGILSCSNCGLVHK